MTWVVMHALGKKPLMNAVLGRYGLKPLKLQKDRCAVLKARAATVKSDRCRLATRCPINRLAVFSGFSARHRVNGGIACIHSAAVSFYLRDPGMRHDLHRPG